MVAVGAAFMLIFLPLSLPALILAKARRLLVVAAILAGLAAILYFAFWLEILDELHIQAASLDAGLSWARKLIPAPKSASILVSPCPLGGRFARRREADEVRCPRVWSASQALGRRRGSAQRY